MNIKSQLDLTRKMLLAKIGGKCAIDGTACVMDPELSGKVFEGKVNRGLHGFHG